MYIRKSSYIKIANHKEAFGLPKGIGNALKGLLGKGKRVKSLDEAVAQLDELVRRVAPVNGIILNFAAVVQNWHMYKETKAPANNKSNWMIAQDAKKEWDTNSVLVNTSIEESLTKLKGLMKDQSVPQIIQAFKKVESAARNLQDPLTRPLDYRGYGSEPAPDPRSTFDAPMLAFEKAAKDFVNIYHTTKK